MRVLYDETHNQTWTADPLLALAMSRRSNEAPRYYSYAHLVDLVRSVLAGEHRRLTEGPITVERLHDVDVLFLNHCCSSRHSHVGVGGEAFFTPAEIDAITAAVEAGMGLLVLGEFENEHWGSNVNDLLARFGLRFNDDLAEVPGHAVHAGRQLHVFEACNVSDHPISHGVGAVSYCSGCTVGLLDQRPVGVVRGSGGAALVAAVEIGRGRVVVAGDSDLFAEPYVSYNDNARLLVQTLQWLGRSRVAVPDGVVLPLAAPTETAHDLMARNARPGPAEGTIVDITPEEHARLRELLDQTPSGPAKDFEAFFEEARLIFHEMPRRLRQALIGFAKRSNPDGVLLLRNLPTDAEVPPTPTRSGQRVPKATWASELWMCCVASALGEPVGYLQEKQGNLFQDVYPTPQNADKLSSESSSILLDFHTEIAFHPHMPEYLLLYGLRQDPDKRARTIFSSVRRFFHLLPPGVRDALFSDLFRTGVDYSFGNVDELRGAGPLVSVLFGDRLDPFLRYDLDLMVGETPEAEYALQVVRGLVNEVQRDVIIEPGSLLILDNRRCVHARSDFKAYYDGRDRWLQRMAVVRDLEPSLRDRVRGTRIIATDFKPFLEDVASPVGGGVR
jgi:alpha-ketoglutarate-dependent taurine dioxygenase